MVSATWSRKLFFSSAIVIALLIFPVVIKQAERRKQDNDTDWVFPNSKARSGHYEDVAYIYPTISKIGGTKFWFHALRNNFITIAEREIGLATSLTKRLVNHARPEDVTEGYAADWTLEQLLRGSQAVADRIDELMFPVNNSFR